MSNFKVIPLSLGSLNTNCYICIDNTTTTHKALIIDPGDDAQFILQTISKNNIIPEAIIATHGHFDHILAAFELQQTLSIPFYIHKDDKFLINNMQQSALYFLKLVTDPPPIVNKFLKADSILKFGNQSLKILHTPGHTPGSICLYSKSQNIVFSGDIIFKNGAIGRYDHKYSIKQALLKSIKKILKLPDKTLIYPGHGEIFTVQEAQLYLS